MLDNNQTYSTFRTTLVCWDIQRDFPIARSRPTPQFFDDDHRQQTLLFYPLSCWKKESNIDVRTASKITLEQVTQCLKIRQNSLIFYRSLRSASRTNFGSFLMNCWRIFENVWEWGWKGTFYKCFHPLWGQHISGHNMALTCISLWHDTSASLPFFVWKMIFGRGAHY